MLADVYWDHHTAEKVALVCPLAKCHLLLSFDELSVLTKIASLRIFEFRHHPSRYFIR